MTKAWLGIDTSNYTTSVSAITENGECFNIKIPLCVKANEKGVRQSDAVFMHVKNLPVAIKRLKEAMGKADSTAFCAVGVSSRPRSVEGSYMPCFLSGISVAESIASLLDVECYEFSHQEGHIRAALYGANTEPPENFYSFHLSGGTCELLEVCRTDFGFSEKITADSADITLGQLVDRTGVLLGLQFPCGVELEKLASKSEKKYKIRITGDEHINLSGFENKVLKMHSEGESYENIASYVYCVITSAVEKMLNMREDKSLPVLFAGGVSGSEILKKYASALCDAYFAPASLSSDNAVGIAVLTKEKYCRVQTDEQ